MTLSSTASRISYSGDGTTTAFSFPYYFIDEEDLVVIITEADGTETVQTITTDYTVTGEGEQAGGTVTMNVAPISGEDLVIYRDPALKQLLDLVENDSLPAEDHEQNLDKIVMMAQRLDNRMDRAVTLSEGFTGSFDTKLPSTLTANAVLTINSTGDGLISGPTTTEIEDAESNALAAANSATAASNSANAASNSANAASASAASAASTLASAFFNDVVFYTHTDSPITLTSTANGKLISLDSSGGAIAITLPTIADVTAPFNMAFILTADGNNVTVSRAGTDTIGASATSKVLNAANTGFQVVADTDTTPDRWSVLEFGSVGDDTVSTAKIQDDAVTTAKIDDDAVTLAKLAGEVMNFLIPTASIMPYGASSAPTGWLLCDGTAVSRTTYADLYTAIGDSFGEGDGTTTFNTPDLRGQFLRGWDNSAGVDPNAGTRTALNTGGNTGDNIGSEQADSTAPNSLSVATVSLTGSVDASNGPSHGPFFAASAAGIVSASGGTTRNPYSIVGAPTTNDRSPAIVINASHSHTLTGDTETRPTNVAVNFIIKT